MADQSPVAPDHSHRLHQRVPSSPALPVLVVGEALIDIVRHPDRVAEERPGGSPANVALSLARLGQASHLLTRVGSDLRGQLIIDHLVSSGVTVLPQSITQQTTSTATATIGPDGDASYTFDLQWYLPDTPHLGAHAAIHTGSIAAFLAPGGDQVIALLERARARADLGVTFDPNIRPILLGSPADARTRVERLVALCDVVKVSDEDLGWLAADGDSGDLANSWLNHGPGLVVVTHGGRGATALFHGGSTSVPAPRVVVADTIGAGDSFMGALIDHLLRHGLLGPETRPHLDNISEQEARAAIVFSVGAAASTCTRPGADPPYGDAGITASR